MTVGNTCWLCICSWFMSWRGLIFDFGFGSTGMEDHFRSIHQFDQTDVWTIGHQSIRSNATRRSNRLHSIRPVNSPCTNCSRPSRGWRWRAPPRTTPGQKIGRLGRSTTVFYVCVCVFERVIYYVLLGELVGGWGRRQSTPAPK